MKVICLYNLYRKEYTEIPTPKLSSHVTIFSSFSFFSGIYLGLQRAGHDWMTNMSWASLVAQLVKNPPAMQETPVQFLVWEDPLEKGKATCSSILENSMNCIVHGVTKSQTWLTFTSASLAILKLLNVGSQQTVENSSRDGNTRPSYMPAEKPVCRSRSNS